MSITKSLSTLNQKTKNAKCPKIFKQVYLLSSILLICSLGQANYLQPDSGPVEKFKHMGGAYESESPSPDGVESYFLLYREHSAPLSIFFDSQINYKLKFQEVEKDGNLKVDFALRCRETFKRPKGVELTSQEKLVTGLACLEIINGKPTTQFLGDLYLAVVRNEQTKSIRITNIPGRISVTTPKGYFQRYETQVPCPAGSKYKYCGDSDSQKID